ncbi:hypothetical protein C2G38_2169456 [Gigaspora rosea]|uniref:Uncharacterized protein n=1 Tax=Gigaspora rosea TaxID=44941 RepID=A0A397VSY1_9GLOM|nr:hypothetical protein C2G38_2169456 [Gigaspora rosea]
MQNEKSTLCGPNENNSITNIANSIMEINIEEIRPAQGALCFYFGYLNYILVNSILLTLQKLPNFYSLGYYNLKDYNKIIKITFYNNLIILIIIL